MEKKSPTRRKTNANLDIQKRSMDAVPRWALALCAVILVLSFAIRQIGLDITTPINRIMTAHAVRIEAEAKNPNLIGNKDIAPMKKNVQTLEEDVKTLTKRVRKLEHWSHSPSTTK